jgi:multidrug efflux pump subunit AcrA (membrane-fusion protein)
MKITTQVAISVASIVVLFSSSTFAQSESLGDTSTTSIRFDNCVVQLIQDIDVPALENGQIKEIHVKPGAGVREGQSIAQLDDSRSRRALDEANLRHQIAETQADDETKVEAARRRAELAQVESDKLSRLQASGSASVHEAERARVEKALYILQYQGAKKEKELAALEAAAEMVTVQASQDSINRHNLKSPVSGIVSSLDRDKGEWVNAGDTVLKIARMDRLRVVVMVSAVDYAPHEVANRRVTVTAVLARGQEIQLPGSVVFVDQEINQGNSYVVWAEFENRLVPGSDNLWLLQPGVNVSTEIHMDQPIVQSASASSLNR